MYKVWTYKLRSVSITCEEKLWNTKYIKLTKSLFIIFTIKKSWNKSKRHIAKLTNPKSIQLSGFLNRRHIQKRSCETTNSTVYVQYQIYMTHLTTTQKKFSQNSKAIRFISSFITVSITWVQSFLTMCTHPFSFSFLHVILYLLHTCLQIHMYSWLDCAYGEKFVIYFLSDIMTLVNIIHSKSTSFPEII